MLKPLPDKPFRQFCQVMKCSSAALNSFFNKNRHTGICFEISVSTGQQKQKIQSSPVVRIEKIKIECYEKDVYTICRYAVNSCCHGG